MDLINDIEKKKLVIKKYILYDIIYLKFRNRKISICYSLFYSLFYSKCEGY